MQQAQASANSRKVEIDTNAKLAEEERLRNLKVAMAKQRAAFGASGISSVGGGSTKSVLEGFLNESEEEKKSREKIDNIRKQAINDSLSQKQEKSLLELSQLEEQQVLGKVLDIL